MKSPDHDALVAVAQAADRRDDADSGLRSAIREAKAQGIPLRTIAEYAQMSHEQVRRIAAD
jgi:hypothetical protein